MTEEQFIKELNSSRNLFITGPAGTGKSYYLNKYIESHDNVLVCAPTGIAALHVGGETMHRIFHIPVPSFDTPSFAKGKKGAITKGQLQVIAKADTIIIDEISMCRNDVFRFAIKVIRKAEKLKGSKIRLIVSGDFSQLPPVVKKGEEKYMRKFKLDTSGYAFTTAEWKSCNFKVVELNEIKRQDNTEFIEQLNQIRIGILKDFSYFEQFVDENPKDENSVYICGTNAVADRINNEYLEAIPGEAVVFQARKEGRANYTSGFDNDLIVVKKGCRIIFVSNDLRYNKYKNGMFGVIQSFHDGYVKVKTENGIIDVYRQEYPLYSYSAQGSSLGKKEVGMIRQFPFKLGKAITIHKSQGQTFDNVIISPDIFAAGQLYVVLSRVRDPKGMKLLRMITRDDVILDPVVQKFYKNGYSWTVKRASSTTTAKKPTAKKPVKKSVTRRTKGRR